MIDEQHGLSRRAHWAGSDKLISRLMAEALAAPELVSLAAGFVDRATLPVAATQEALSALWSNPALARAALQYGTTVGYVPLREAILARMAAADGSARGCKAAVRGSSRDHRRQQPAPAPRGRHAPGPRRHRALRRAKLFRLLMHVGQCRRRTVGVETDSEGMIPEALEQELARRKAGGELARVKAVYVSTYYDNPAGITTALTRRQQLLEIARRWSPEETIYLIEDAAYRELRYYGDDVPSLFALDEDGDRVIHAGTFSKPYSPGIRVGWGILPPRLVEPLLAQKGNVDFGSPHFNQVLMSSVMETGLFDRHVAALRESYRDKLDATLRAAQAELAPLGVQWVRPTGGLYVWMRLPEWIDTGVDGPLFPRAVAEGTLYVPGECCYPQEGRPRQKNMLRLSFGVPSIEEIGRGVQALARAMKGLKSVQKK